ncbi:MAG: cation:proton antiporter, partial [Sulfuricaulis sp.]|nr:cation:proton antiporter [Sulfuricaulis sp.]
RTDAAYPEPAHHAAYRPRRSGTQEAGEDAERSCHDKQEQRKSDGTLFLDSWSWRAVGLALFLFMVARPVSVLASLLGTRTSWPIRGMVGWFGVRGIGSLYYLMYAIQHGLPEDLALDLIQLTLIAVSLSILVHGTSVKPLMSRFWHHRKHLPTP